MKQEYFDLCTQAEDKAETCIYCTKYWLSQHNYQCNSLFVCTNWDLIKGCQYAKVNPVSDHLCNIRYVSAHYTEDGELYCALIQDFPEHPLRCSAYDDGGEE